MKKEISVLKQKMKDEGPELNNILLSVTCHLLSTASDAGLRMEKRKGVFFKEVDELCADAEKRMKAARSRPQKKMKHMLADLLKGLDQMDSDGD